jgi:hypothetical protein
VLILTDLLPRYDKINLPRAKYVFVETLHSIFNCNGALPAKLSGFKVQNKLLQQSLFTKSRIQNITDPQSLLYFWQSGGIF